MAAGVNREHWGGTLGFVLATAGSAIGLGNIWRFPYIAGQNGGGAFVLIYLAMALLIGLPVMLAEIVLGRRTQLNPIGAFRALNPPQCALARWIGIPLAAAGVLVLLLGRWGWGLLILGLGLTVLLKRWTVVGLLASAAAFMILSYYSVVGGWTLLYMGKAATGGLNFADVAAAQVAFGAAVTNPGQSVVFHLLFMGLCMAVVLAGIRNGVERAAKILMPALFVMLVVLVLRALTLPGAMEGVRFYLAPDFSKVTGRTFLTALGQMFFSLSLGMGAVIVYGSYLQKNVNLFRTAGAVIVLDTLVALLAGLVIFPAVFAFGMEPAAGTGLVFQVLPTIFGQMAFGPLWAFLFFTLLMVAAWTSAISLLETITAAAMDEWGWGRRQATLVSGGAIAVLGLLSAVSIADWSRIEGVRGGLVALFAEVPGSFFDLMDAVTSNWMLTLGGLATCIFTGWIWGTRRAMEEIREGAGGMADAPWLSWAAGLHEDEHYAKELPGKLTLALLWGVFVRFVCPAAILVVFLNAIGALGK
jgi:neurotransmitter:Na+ symporter, NSS family